MLEKQPRFYHEFVMKPGLFAQIFQSGRQGGDMMVRKIYDQVLRDGVHYVKAAGLSTDQKPTAGICTGSYFIEVNTAKELNIKKREDGLHLLFFTLKHNMNPSVYDAEQNSGNQCYDRR